MHKDKAYVVPQTKRSFELSLTFLALSDSKQFETAEAVGVCRDPAFCGGLIRHPEHCVALGGVFRGVQRSHSALCRRGSGRQRRQLRRGHPSPRGGLRQGNGRHTNASKERLQRRHRGYQRVILLRTTSFKDMKEFGHIYK